MNKILRFVVILVLVSFLVVVAGNKVAWANTLAPKAAENAPQVGMAAPQAIQAGTVAAPNCEGVRVIDNEFKSVCGIATLTGFFGTNVFALLDPRPDGFQSKIVNLNFNSGDVRICFAAPDGGLIYYQVDANTDWVVLRTDIVDGIACSTVSLSGNYVFGK